MKLELLTNATVVDDAIGFVSDRSNGKLKSSANDSEHNKESSELDHDEDQLEEEQEEEITTNEVF